MVGAVANHSSELLGYYHHVPTGLRQQAGEENAEKSRAQVQEEPGAPGGRGFAERGIGIILWA